MMTARTLVKRGHEIVIIERDKGHIDALSEELDCGYIHGDGSKPAILREADPAQTDFLFCLTDNDQSNILASLAWRLNRSAWPSVRRFFHASPPCPPDSTD